MSSERPLKILFSMRHLGSFRMYESVIRQLAGRGHAMHIVVDRQEKLGWKKGLDQLLADMPNVTWDWSVRMRRVSYWFEFSRVVRLWLDYLRYYEPMYDDALILRRRAADLLPAWMVRATERWPLRTRVGRGLFRRLLRSTERALPRVAEIDAALAADPPDVMLITPLIYLASPQVEMLRSAKALGLKTALCVGSWDHLSSKAVIRDVPDRVFVWNDTQREEALTLHNVPADQVVVTGAQCYDQWFSRRPSRSREEFCKRVGLPSDRPFVLYVCGALFWGSPRESDFAVSWIKSLRSSSDETLRNVGILVRPHPARHGEWSDIDLSEFENVTLYGSNPVDEHSKNDYFDSLYYSAAVIGLNTSAFLEAGIVGRPVHAILPPEFHDNQEGTLHFRYLMQVGGGLLRHARDLDTHGAQLRESIAGGADNSRFIEAFIRPHGTDRSATDVFVEGVEALGRAAVAADGAPSWYLPIWRAALAPIAWSTRFAFMLSDGRFVRQASRSLAPFLGALGLWRVTSADPTDRLSREIARERRRSVKQTARDKRQAIARRRVAQRQASQQRKDDQRRTELEQKRSAKEVTRRNRLLEHQQAKQRQHGRHREEERRKRRRTLTQRILARLGMA